MAEEDTVPTDSAPTNGAATDTAAAAAPQIKQRILAQLEKPKVPAQMVERIESRMGG